MKNLVIRLDEERPSYILPDGMTGQDWTTFKRDYEYFIAKEIALARVNKKVLCTIDMSALPELYDNLTTLKGFMKVAIENPYKGQMFTSFEWNSRREEAKQFFTAPCISELDASGFIKKPLL